MKREILFRAKRKGDNVWVYGDLITAPIHHDCVIKEFDCINHSVYPETVGQFAGKTLIKGDKVFEGTIAFHEKAKSKGDQRTYLVCVYIHEWAMFAWLTSGEYIKYQDMGAKSLDESMFWTYTIEHSSDYHHAGNIYDNPELL